jgi:predicted naringenin-chalcone synthase
MNVRIAGIGCATPTQRYTAEQTLELIRQRCCETPKQERLLRTIFRGAQIQQRASVLGPDIDAAASFFPPGISDDISPSTRQRMQRYAAEITPLAARACGGALKNAALGGASVTHLVTVSCTGFFSPGLDLQLIEALKLPPRVERTHVGFMGCHGALNGLRVARALAGSDPQAKVLLCAAELCTLHLQYGWNLDNVLANALFADGAAALVLDSAESPGDWQVAASGSCVFPDTGAAMSWRIGNHGFAMTLSTEVSRIIADGLAPWLRQWLSRHKLAVSDVGSWVIHPGGPRIVEAVQSALSLPDPLVAPSRAILAEYGNMSSPTVLFILEALRNSGARRPCVMLAFGPGLSAEAALLE